jgi:hypothetical protein
MWQLVQLDADGKEVQRHPITTEALTIGRGKDRRIVLPSTSVSRRHAQVLLQDAQPLLVDEGSANGTRVNGKAAAGPTPLRDGDEIGVAEFRLRVQRAQPAVPEPAAAGPAAPAAAPAAGDSQGPRFRSAKELLEQQITGIRSYRSDASGGSDRKVVEFEQSWKNLIASLRDLRDQLRNEPRIMYFTIDREDREATVKVADRNTRGGGIVLSLSRHQPQGQDQNQLMVWIRVLGENDVHFSDPQLALERFVQRIASRLA